MKISKVANTYGDYVYVLPNHALLQKKGGASYDEIASNQPRYGFVSLNFSGNMAVIKTRPGYASSLAYDVDNNNVPGVLGTIAGDDTLLIVLAEDANRMEIKRLLEPIIANPPGRNENLRLSGLAEPPATVCVLGPHGMS